MNVQLHTQQEKRKRAENGLEELRAKLQNFQEIDLTKDQAHRDREADLTRQVRELQEAFDALQNNFD